MGGGVGHSGRPAMVWTAGRDGTPRADAWALTYAANETIR